jgi:hypothetical protein
LYRGYSAFLPRLDRVCAVATAHLHRTYTALAPRLRRTSTATVLRQNRDCGYGSQR